MPKTRVFLFAFVGYLSLITTPSFALTETQWKERPLAERQAYVMGVVDGWSIILRLTKEEARAGSNPSLTDETIDGVALCIQKRNMPYTQIESLVEQYMKEHPIQGDHDMASFAFAAVYTACKKKQ